LRINDRESVLIMAMLLRANSDEASHAFQFEAGWAFQIGSRLPLAQIAWVDLMMSLRDEKVKGPSGRKRFAFAF
jgi:hypothetical protein